MSHLQGQMTLLAREWEDRCVGFACVMVLGYVLLICWLLVRCQSSSISMVPLNARRGSPSRHGAVASTGPDTMPWRASTVLVRRPPCPTSLHAARRASCRLHLALASCSCPRSPSCLSRSGTLRERSARIMDGANGQGWKGEGGDRACHVQ